MNSISVALGLLLASAVPAAAHSPFSVPIPGDSMIVYRLSWVEPGKFMRSGAVIVDGNHLAGGSSYDEAVVRQVYQGLHRKYGIGAVVNLRAESDEDEQAARAAGMRFCHLPLADLHAPSPQQVVRFFDFVRESRARHQVVLWHCAGGIGRAGIMSAMVRLSEGWSTRDAVIEMLQMGLGYDQAQEQMPALNNFARSLGKPEYFPPGWTASRQSVYDYGAIARRVARQN